MSINKEQDFGTPASTASQLVTLEIDGFQVTAPAGTSIMRAAASIGIDIPKLCATDSIEPFGSCRLCVVQIEGGRGMPASCTTPVAEGLKVVTQNQKLADVRRGIMELYISDHPLDCLTCSANGDCELQDMAGAVGLREVRYHPVETHLNAAKDESNPYFSFDPSKCIVCSRCVRACEETQGTFALTIDGRGFDSKVSPSQNQAVHGFRMRFLWRLCTSLPDSNLNGKIGDRPRTARTCDCNHLCLLWCRLFIQGRNERRASHPHGAAQRRQSQSWSFLCKRPLCVWLCHA